MEQMLQLMKTVYLSKKIIIFLHKCEALWISTVVNLNPTGLIEELDLEPLLKTNNSINRIFLVMSKVDKSSRVHFQCPCLKIVG